MIHYYQHMGLAYIKDFLIINPKSPQIWHLKTEIRFIQEKSCWEIQIHEEFWVSQQLLYYLSQKQIFNLQNRCHFGFLKKYSFHIPKLTSYNVYNVPHVVDTHMQIICLKFWLNYILVHSLLNGSHKLVICLECFKLRIVLLNLISTLE